MLHMCERSAFTIDFVGESKKFDEKTVKRNKKKKKLKKMSLCMSHLSVFLFFAFCFLSIPLLVVLPD